MILFFPNEHISSTSHLKNSLNIAPFNGFLISRPKQNKTKKNLITFKSHSHIHEIKKKSAPEIEFFQNKNKNKKIKADDRKTVARKNKNDTKSLSERKTLRP